MEQAGCWEAVEEDALKQGYRRSLRFSSCSLVIPMISGALAFCSPLFLKFCKTRERMLPYAKMEFAYRYSQLKRSPVFLPW